MQKKIFTLLLSVLLLSNTLATDTEACNPIHNYGGMCMNGFDIVDYRIEQTNDALNRLLQQQPNSNVADAQQATGNLAHQITVPAMKMALKAAQLSGQSVPNIEGSGFCLGEFTGQQSIKGNPALLKKQGCSSIPLKDSDTVNMFSFGIPTSLLSSFCPSVYPPSEKPAQASFCAAYGHCDSGPTVAMVMSGPLLACIAANPAIQAATGGLSEAVAQFAKNGLNQVAIGASVGGDFAKNFKIWDGNHERDITLSGHYFDYVQFSQGVFQNLNLPNWIGLTGHASRIVRLPSEFVSNPSDIDNLGNFAYLMYLTGTMTIKIGSLTNGAFPNSPAIPLANAAGFVNNIHGDPSLPPKGIYLYFQKNDMDAQVNKAFSNYVIQNFQGIIQSLMPSGIPVSELLRVMPDNDERSELALAITEESFNFKLRSPFPGSLTSVLAEYFELECTIRNSDKKIGCKLDFRGSRYFEVVKEGLYFVARKTLGLFGQDEGVIASISEELLNTAGAWTGNAIQETASILSHAADQSLKMLASPNKFFCGKTWKKAAECGVEVLHGFAKCAAKIAGFQCVPLVSCDCKIELACDVANACPQGSAVGDPVQTQIFPPPPLPDSSKGHSLIPPSPAPNTKHWSGNHLPAVHNEFRSIGGVPLTYNQPGNYHTNPSTLIPKP